MTRYEAELRAYGIPADAARRDALVNEIGRLNNRDLYAKQYEADAMADGPAPVIPFADRRGI